MKPMAFVGAPVHSIEVVQVVCVKVARGEGRAEDDRCRIVTQYWTPTGEFLAESDPCAADRADGGTP